MSERSWLLDRLFPPDAGQVVAYSRVALAGVALLAVFFDPTHPASFSELTHLTLILYAAYAVAVALISGHLVTDGLGGLARHAVDIAVFAVLLYLTDGPNSPLFVFLTFAIVSGALRWGATGAVCTAVVLMMIYLAVGFFGPGRMDDIDLNQALLRAAYLLVAGVLIGYFGAHRQGSRDRLARLAAWPRPEHRAVERPELASSLRHAALVLEMRRMLVVWQEGGGGHECAHWDGTALHLSQLPQAPDEPLVAPALAARSFMARDPLETSVLLSGGKRTSVDRPLAGWLAEAFEIGSFATAPFFTGNVAGRIFVLDTLETHPPRTELLSLTEIVAGRIGLEFEHFRLRHELAASAAARERARLARDLHDSVLQNLAAAAMQLETRARAEPSLRAATEEVQAVLAAQQRRIREFLSPAKPAQDPKEPVSLQPELESVASELAVQWACDISCRVKPAPATLPAHLVGQLKLILAEAVANAVRHGMASKISVTVEAEEDVRLAVQDNGLGQPAAAGRFNEVVPISLGQRVEELGGSCRLEIGSSGATLLLSLPRS